MYILPVLKSCSVSGMEAGVESNIYTLMYAYLARKRNACVELHPLMYIYLVRKRVARVERKAIYNISRSF